MSNRASMLHPDAWVCLSGQTEYQIDLKQGDCQLDYDLRADKEMSVYVCLRDKVIPLGVGHRVAGRLFLGDVRWLLLRFPKAATVAASVYQVDRTVVDKVDPKPCAMFVPELPSVDLKSMVSRMVGQRLEEAFGENDGPEIPLEELFDDDLADGEEEFGPGYMEVDEATAAAFEERAAAARRSRGDRSAQSAHEGSEQDVVEELVDRDHEPDDRADAASDRLDDERRGTARKRPARQLDEPGRGRRSRPRLER